MATKIEVILNGVGSITIEHEDEAWTKKQVQAYADKALSRLVDLRPERQHPIGFGAGSSTDTDRNARQDQDPYEAGWVIR